MSTLSEDDDGRYLLTRAFAQARKDRHPQDSEVQSAARLYHIRGFSEHVHQDIKKLTPRRNVGASYRYDRIRQGIEDIVDRYKDNLIDNTTLPLELERSRRAVEPDSDDESAGSSSTFYEKFHKANQRAAIELDASTPAVELPAGPQAVELPVHEKPIELQGDY